MSKWEYQVLRVGTQKFTGPGIDVEGLGEKLNALGLGGWELTGVVPEVGTAGTTTAVLLVLKRAR